MPIPLIENLKKIQYSSLEQFSEDINRNFAIIENSPLYKGIPGSPGLEGDDGNRGIRGIKFLFVDYTKFNTIFPGELSIPSKIDLNFINGKVSSFETIQSLFEAFNITEFVDKDVIILTNSIMLSYDEENESFVDTGMAFNPEANLLSNINQIIENYVTYYIDNNSILNNLTNVFGVYQTYAKNYADNNSSFITNELTASSVYSPYIAGFNNTTGVHIDNHKYYGYHDNQFSLSDKGTYVFGSMKRYYQLLMATISTSGTETLSSDYAPGAGNIPSLVVMQDTYKNGIYIGHKDKANFKRFGSIYKNEANDLVIKSDSSQNESEYSELLINRSYMRYKKLVQFFDSLEVSRDLSVFGDINNKHIKSGKFTDGATPDNNHNINRTEFGSNVPGAVSVNVSEFEEYVHYLDKVLVTNASGKLLKDYAIERLAMNNLDLVDMTEISTMPSNQYNILTSNYFQFLAKKSNNITNFIKANYWRKNQFNTGVIPSLHLSETLRSDGDFSLAGLLISNKLTSTVSILSNSLNVASNNIRLSEFKNKVLVTNEAGVVSKDYKLEDVSPTITSDSITGLIEITPLQTPDKQILTSVYYNFLASLIAYNSNFMVQNYWRKNQYDTGEIPGIWVNNLLKSTGDVEFRNKTGLHFHLINNNGYTNLTIGNGQNDDTATNITLDTHKINFTKFNDKVLITDTNGKLLNKYYLEPGNITLNTAPQLGNSDTFIPTFVMPVVPNENNSIPVWRHIKAITDFLTTVMNWTQSNFWRKSQWFTGVIPNLKLSNELKAAGNVEFGSPSNPNIKTSTTTTTINKELKITSATGAVLITNEQGVVSTQYKLETKNPVSSNPLANPLTDSYSIGTIRQNFWTKSAAPQNWLEIPSDLKRIPTSKHWRYLLTNIMVIKEMLFDRPTFTELAEVYRKLAIFQKDGGMVLWNKPANLIPIGWAEVVDWRGRMPVGFDQTQLEFNTLGHKDGNKIKALNAQNLPQHSHKMFANAVSTIANDPVLTNSPATFANSRGVDTDYVISRGVINATLGDTSISGENLPFSLMNPYKVVYFIEYVGIN